MRGCQQKKGKKRRREGLSFFRGWWQREEEIPGNRGEARKEEKKRTEKISLRGADTGICFFELSFLLSSGHFVEFSRSCVSILDV